MNPLLITPSFPYSDEDPPLGSWIQLGWAAPFTSIEVDDAPVMHAQMPWSNQGTAYGGGPGQGGSLVPKQMLGGTDWPIHNPTYVSRRRRHAAPPSAAPPHPFIPSHISPDPPPAAPRPPPRAYHLKHDCIRRPNSPDCIKAEKDLQLSYSYAWEPNDRPIRMPEDIIHEPSQPRKQGHARGGRGGRSTWVQLSGGGGESTPAPRGGGARRDGSARRDGGARRMGVLMGVGLGAGAGLVFFVSVEACRRWRLSRYVRARIAWRRRWGQGNDGVPHNRKHESAPRKLEMDQCLQFLDSTVTVDSAYDINQGRSQLFVLQKENPG